MFQLNLVKYFKSHTSETVRAYVQNTVSTSLPVYGVPLRDIRALAKTISGADAAAYVDFYMVPTSYEHAMLSAMVIGRATYNDLVEYMYIVDSFMDFVDNWSVCDTFAAALKIVGKRRELFWDFVKDLVASGEEYRARLGYVLMLYYYLDEPAYFERICKVMERYPTEQHFVEYAKAWLLSYAWRSYPQQTGRFLVRSGLCDQTKLTAVRKILAFRDIPQSDKQPVRGLQDVLQKRERMLRAQRRAEERAEGGGRPRKPKAPGVRQLEYERIRALVESTRCEQQEKESKV
ncbi:MULTISPECIES: DNA alkylation repair protein [Oscillospiraceae]|uniref:DNA alkylation repair enzyme n=1 Tax=Harryflintia acetispora TaxID=1849041 RepID=A0A9X8Y9B7_9FIRM|nr:MULTISPECIES: DNA alkylation repair protein [Oscillospiraceae]TCL45247.1 DNA alkylation repair enzyme [Harryflintia acetispora]